MVLMHNLLNQRQKLIAGLMLLALLFSLAACSGRTKVDSNLRIKGAPDWVNKGTQVVSDKRGKVIHGVGIAPHMGDLSLQRSTADTRARAEVARVFSVFINDTVQDYSVTTGSMLDADVERSLKAETSKVLQGAKIIGRWSNKRTKDIYSFAELDTRALDKLISSSAKLDSGFKTFYQQKFNQYINDQAAGAAQ